MNCPTQEIIEYYIVGQLKANEVTEFEKHLQVCPACTARLAEAHENEKLLVEMRTFEKVSLKAHEHSTREVATIDRAQTLLGERYRVIRKIGEGSAGEVFQVADTLLERLVEVISRCQVTAKGLLNDDTRPPVSIRLFNGKARSAEHLSNCLV